MRDRSDDRKPFSEWIRSAYALWTIGTTTLATVGLLLVNITSIKNFFFPSPAPGIAPDLEIRDASTEAYYGSPSQILNKVTFVVSKAHNASLTDCKIVLGRLRTDTFSIPAGVSQMRYYFVFDTRNISETYQFTVECDSAISPPLENSTETIAIPCLSKRGGQCPKPDLSHMAK
jgi:hypothetical protein